MPSHPLVSRITAASLRHPWRFLLVALTLAVGGAWLASGLEVRSSFEELLPSDVPSVAHAKELVRRVGGEGTVYVNVEALDGPQGLPRAEALALRLADEYRALGPEVIRAVEATVRPVESWYADHWPLFLDLADLRKARDELVGEIGKAKARANPLFSGLEEEEPSALEVSDPLLDPVRPGPREQVLERFAGYRDGFMAHPDGRSVTLVARPTGTSLGVDEARALLDRMRAVAEAHRPELDAARLRVGFAGSFPSFLAEYEAIINDVVSTFLLVLALVLISMVLFYREARSVLALGVVILAAVAVTFGITRLVIGYLNTQTAFLGSIVAGNGINYGIVYLARMVQLRREGVALGPACEEGAKAAVTGTLLASLGTAISFGTLIIAANRGFRHFGFIGGVGMLLCWAATFALLPAVLALFERVWPVRPRERRARQRSGRLLALVFARPRLMIVAFALIGIASLAIFLWRLPTVMERNLENLGNDVRGSAVLRRDQDRANMSLGTSPGDRARKVAGGSVAVVALLPSPDAAERYCEAIRERMRNPRVASLVADCQTVSSVVPTQQVEKLRLIGDIRARLTDKLIARLPPQQAARAREIRAQLGAQRPLRVDDAPSSLVDRFREHDRTVGRVVFVRARHDAKLELGPNLQDFTAAVRNVPVDGRTFDAAGETLVVADLLSNIEHEGPVTTVLSFLGVCILVLIFFRGARASTQLLLSLSLGVVLMGGVATLLGIKINFFNFIVYPITFGIAVDYGANVLARMNHRRSALPALAEVGPAVALCSWTTIIGYGSLLFSINRALRSFGWYAMLGELTTIVTALTLLPALALVFPPRGWPVAELPAPFPVPVTAGPAQRQEATHAE